MDIDLRVMELLCSKLCHDLISPVSAINNGVELIEDIGGSVVDEAMKLIGDSAVLGAKRLKLFRLAYGRAGSEEGLGIKDVRPVVEAYFAGSKIVLEWPENLPNETAVGARGLLKTLINILILSEEILAYGGAITLAQGENEGVDVKIAGRAAMLSESLQSALENTVSVDDLTPRTIEAYVTGKFAAQFGIVIQHQTPETDTLNLSLFVPPTAYDERVTS